MVAMDVFAHAFGFDAKSDDVWTTLGKVTAVNSGTLSVLLGGSAVPADCESYCGAQVGDVVLVVVMKGIARAVAVKGGGEFLPLSGGKLTGELEIARPSDGSGIIYLGNNTVGQRNGILTRGGGTSAHWVLSTISSDNNDGDAVIMGAGGMTVVGSGESAKSIYDEMVSGNAPEGSFSADSEQVFISSDYNVYIMPNCQTVANRHCWMFGSNGHLVDKNYDLDISSATNGLTANIDHVIGCGDKNDRWANYINFWDKTDGSCNTLITARKYVNGATVNNSVMMTVDKNGNQSTTFSAPNAWMIGLAGYNPTYTTVVSDVITASSGATINQVSFSKWGRVGMLNLLWTNLNAISVPANGNITNYSIGTLTPRARSYFRVHPVSDGDNAGTAFYNMDSTGAFYVGAFDSRGSAYTIAANSSHRVSAVYLTNNGTW